MAEKKQAPYSGPALIEANLPDYDKSELITERDLVAKVQQCKDAAKIAQGAVAKLQDVKKGLDKKSPDFKKESKEIDAKVKGLQGVAKKKCKLQHLGCVPSDNSTRVPMPKSITDDINKQNGTNVDFAQLSAWEGGAFTKGYIPWWPYLNKEGSPKIVMMPDSSGKNGPRIKGELGGEPKNKSGPTVGVGVDLGQYGENGFFKILNNSNTGDSKMPPVELDALKEKIKPYFNKKGGEACKYLRDHPLELSEKEINFLNKAAHEEVLGIARKKYETYANKKDNQSIIIAPKKFNELTKEQQTALLSNAYQYGSPKLEIIKAIATGDKALIPETREKLYLKNSMFNSK
ncbi:MAG: pesticin C-terminus-like muramidase [Pseudomonadota bacterium]